MWVHHHRGIDLLVYTMHTVARDRSTSGLLVPADGVDDAIGSCLFLLQGWSEKNIWESVQWIGKV